MASQQDGQTAGTKLKTLLRPSWEHTPLLLLTVYYVARLVFFAISMDHSIPPDEVKHLDQCQLYSESLWLPEKDPETISYARTTAGYTPYAYYFLMGKLLHLNFFGLSDLIFLRFISVFFGLATVYVGWRFITMLSDDRFVRVLFLLITTNTLMFIVSQSSVTYDSLTNLVAALSLLFMARHFSTPSPNNMIRFLLCIALGTLTKITFLPLALVLVACLLIHDRRQLTNLKTLLRTHLRTFSPRQWTAIAALVLLVGLNTVLYGRNLIVFKRIVPKADQFPLEQVLDSPIAARNYILTGYLEERLSLDDALDLTERIDLPAAQRDTENLLRYYNQRKAEGEMFEPASRLAYGYTWLWMMSQSTYGVFGHEGILKERTALAPYMVIFTAASILLLSGWRKFTRPIDGYLLFIVVAYGLGVMQFVGYTTYIQMQGPLIAVQGRYLFPVLVPAYALVATSLLSGWPRYVKAGILIAVGLVFIEGDFHFYIKNAHSDFYYSFLERILFL